MSTTKKRITLCLTANDLKMINEIARALDMTNAEIYRTALYNLFNSIVQV